MLLQLLLTKHWRHQTLLQGDTQLASTKRFTHSWETSSPAPSEIVADNMMILK
jgi:hypothetical protein